MNRLILIILKWGKLSKFDLDGTQDQYFYYKNMIIKHSGINYENTQEIVTFDVGVNYKF